MKIVIAEGLAPHAIQLFESHKGWRVITTVPSELNAEHLADADALLVRGGVKVNRAMLEMAPMLRVIGRAGVEVDNVDLAAATASGVLVMNTPGGNAASVAEHTIAMMLSLARSIPAASASTVAGRWERLKFMGSELRGKTLGVLGLGSIGREVAMRAKGFAMRVIAVDPYVNPQVAADTGIEMVTLEQLYRESDYISLHTALTAETKAMIDHEAIARMKEGVRIINCARGELIDPLALAGALNSGKVAGAGLDVFDPEPLPPGHPLLEAPNLVATPHIAGATEEAKEIVGVRLAEQVVEYLTSGVAVNAVNMPSLSPEQYRALGPFISLAERLGVFAVSVGSGSLKSAKLTYSGRIAERNTTLLRNAALAGLLNRSLSHKANLVNAMQLASSRGVSVTEVHETRNATFTDSIRLEVLTSEGRVTVEGAVILGNSRLLSVNGIHCEARLEGHLTYLMNEDVPGVIGFIGAVLGRNGVNIACFSLGRSESPEQPGGPLTSVSVVETDTPVPEPVLAEILTNPAMKAARVIEVD